MRARRRSVSALLLLAQLCGSQNQTSSVRSPNTPAGVQCLNLTYDRSDAHDLDVGSVCM